MQLKRVLPKGKYLVRVGRVQQVSPSHSLLARSIQPKITPVASRTITAAKPITPTAETREKPTLTPASTEAVNPMFYSSQLTTCGLNWVVMANM